MSITDCFYRPPAIVNEAMMHIKRTKLGKRHSKRNSCTHIDLLAKKRCELTDFERKQVRDNTPMMGVLVCCFWPLEDVGVCEKSIFAM